jgi:very-short-patch-repair endonuclease
MSRVNKTNRKRPDLIGNNYRAGFKPWNAGKTGVYKKETLDKLRARKLGRVLSEEHKAKIQKASVKFWSDPNYRAKHHKSMKEVGETMKGEKNVSKRPDVRAKMSLAASRQEVIDSKARKMPYSNTSIELIVRAELERRGVEFKANHQLFGKYNVDIFIEPNIVIECDGDYWHSLDRVNLKDKRRDGALKTMRFKIYRFWGEDIKCDVGRCVDSVLELKQKTTNEKNKRTGEDRERIGVEGLVR